MKLVTIEDAWEISQFTRQVVEIVNSGYKFMYEVPGEVHGQYCFIFLFSASPILSGEELADKYESLAYDD